MREQSQRRYFVAGAFALLLALLINACSAMPGGLPSPAAATPSPSATATMVPSVSILSAEGRQSPSVSPTAKDASSGVAPMVQEATDSVKVGAWTYMVTAAYRTPEAATSREHGLMALAAEGVWQVVHLRVENNSDLAQTLVKEDFLLKDGAGNTYEVNIATGDYSFANFLYQPGDNLEAGAAGETALLFDVDPAAADLKLYLGGGAVAVAITP